MNQKETTSEVETIDIEHYSLIKEITKAGAYYSIQRNLFNKWQPYIKNNIESHNQYDDGKLTNLCDEYIKKILRQDRQEKDENYLTNTIELIFKVLNHDVKSKLIEDSFSKINNNLKEEEKIHTTEIYKHVENEFLTLPYYTPRIKDLKFIVVNNIIDTFTIVINNLDEHHVNKYQKPIIIKNFKEGIANLSNLYNDRKLMDVALNNGKNQTMFQKSNNQLNNFRKEIQQLDNKFSYRKQLHQQRNLGVARVTTKFHI